MSTDQEKLSQLEQRFAVLSARLDQTVAAAQGAGVNVDAVTKEHLLALLAQVEEESQKDKQTIAALQKENDRLRYRAEFVVAQLKQELGRQ